MNFRHPETTNFQGLVVLEDHNLPNTSAADPGYNATGEKKNIS